MNVSDLLNILNELLHPEFFHDYGPNGLQVGDPQALVHKIAVAVTADLATIEKAIVSEANVLIVHHGIFWKGMPYPITGVVYQRVRRLIEKNIHLIAYHLPLDAHSKIGNNWKAAQDLGWQQLEAFGSSRPSLGVKGVFPEKDIQDFIAELSSYYQTTVLAQALGGKEKVASAALISGGAYREVYEAKCQDVDCFITGNFDEPAWSLAHELAINFLAFGHTATEKVGPKALVQHLKELGICPVEFLDTENPF
ncbi:Nif3-like dinuclear metal center hexameric protein [Chlamydia sp.]|uniref:Nif3-like dinuclear metal center hexameric protein n=1 Tax=Chlamydia sp. TaxID=35827 RepID=UPI0025B7D761|nr:Nif3-like dinuclear metal center hexameric protein [Chlamydia sp.]MBQ8498732.1 Nif3-like dinuclear metal center hexameric protein [Chlamydia sp.]